MNNEEDSYHQDIIDEDLYEEFDEEELAALVEEARQGAWKKEYERRQQRKQRKSRFPKWVFWLIAITMVMNLIALLPQTVSIPAIEFLKTSASLSTQKNIQAYKEAVVVIETDDSRGTGFSFNEKGDILTNYHVIEGYDAVTVAFREEGLFVGEVKEIFPEVDLAILTTEESDMPYLPLESEFAYEEEESFYFIGNPLRFTGIANKGEVLDYVNVSSKEQPVVMLDAPVYRGNSGSPIINKNGKVEGVVFATLDHDIEGRVGLFIPIDYLHERYKEENGGSEE